MFLDDIVFVPLNQEGLFAIIDKAHADLVLQFRWTVLRKRGRPYAIRSRRVDGKSRNFLMHRFLLPTIDGAIDHINGNGLDNRRLNLRPATNGQNQWNRGRQRNNASGYKGVSYIPRLNRWWAQIVADGKHHNLGLHDAPEEAARAYDAAARDLHGAFAYQNFPE